MKPLKTSVFGLLLLAASTAVSFAQITDIHIVASNGDRGPTQTAISKILQSGWTFEGQLGGATATTNFSNATGSNWGAWAGTFNGSLVRIKVSYFGALAGVASLAGNLDTRFVVSNGTGTAALPDPRLGVTQNTDYAIAKADFAFSTNFQSTSPFNGTYLGTTYDELDAEIVGVSPLGFYASPGFPVEGANLTTQLAQLLYTSGSVSLAQFTGNFAAHQNYTVWPLGRNTDAGQRYGAYAEIGLGTSTAVFVRDPRSNRTGQSALPNGFVYGGAVSSHPLWPAETVSGVSSPLGGGGFSGGAALAEFLTVTLGPDAYKGRFGPGVNQVDYPNAIGGYYIGYLTPGDANTRVLGGGTPPNQIPEANRGVALSYNGVALTNDNVKSGKYTAWLYNRLLRPSGGIPDTLKATFATSLANQIKTVDATVGGGLKDDTDFKVRRFTDGGLVIPK